MWKSPATYHKSLIALRDEMAQADPSIESSGYAEYLEKLEALDYYIALHRPTD